MFSFIGTHSLVAEGDGRRFTRAAAVPHRRAGSARLDHPLLVKSLKVADDLRDHPDELAGNIRDVLLRQLTLLLSPGARSAEGRLELRHSIRRAETLPGIALPELAETEPALHGRVLELRLALQHPDNLRHDRQQLPYHFVDILLTELPRCLAVSGVSHCSMR